VITVSPFSVLVPTGYPQAIDPPSSKKCAPNGSHGNKAQEGTVGRKFRKNCPTAFDSKQPMAAQVSRYVLIRGMLVGIFVNKERAFRL